MTMNPGAAALSKAAELSQDPGALRALVDMQRDAGRLEDALAAAERLLAGDYTLEQGAVKVKTTRALDRGLADVAHLELAKRVDAIS